MKSKLMRVAAVALIALALGAGFVGADSAAAKEAGITWCRTC